MEMVTRRIERIAVILLTLALLIMSGPAMSVVTLTANAASEVSTWEELRQAIEDGETDITIAADLYADSTIEISKNVSIKGKDGQTIYQKKRDKYDTMFKVTGGTLTLDEKLTLSGKTADCNGSSASYDEIEVIPSKTLDDFLSQTFTLQNGSDYLAVSDGMLGLVQSGGAKFSLSGSYLMLNGNKVGQWGSAYGSISSTSNAFLVYQSDAQATVTKAVNGEKYLLYIYRTDNDTDGYLTPTGANAYSFNLNDAGAATQWEAAVSNSWKIGDNDATDNETTATNQLKAYNEANPKGYKYNGVEYTVAQYGSKEAAYAKAKEAVDAAGGQGCDGADCPGADTYTNTTFPGGTSIDAPKGFFVQVEGGKAVLNGATLENFITSRDKGTSPKYVAPVAVIGASSSFDIAAGTIQNNIVGYVVQDSKANESADKIKAYVKGGAPNAQRKPNSVRRNKQAGIDGDDPGSGIMGTSGAVIYTGGAKGDVTGGEIKFNRADTGGIFVTGDGTQVNLKEGTDINNNVGVQFGGGTTVEDGGFIAMTGGEISQNVAWFGGGAVFATENGIKWLLGQKGMGERKDGWFTMEGGKMDSNTAFTRGGAILTDSDGVALKKGVLSNNMSRMLGGAVYVMGDHPDFTYTMYIEKGYVHENKAVSAGYKGTVATTAKLPRYDKETNIKLSKKLTAPNGCNPPAALFDGDMEVNSDDLVDGYPNNQTISTDGTGGGIWLCSYGNTTIDLSSASQFYIKENTATGSLRNNPISAPGEGGDDFHKDTKNNGSLVVTGITEDDKWYDQNKGESGEIYTSPTGEPGIKDTGLRNLINKGDAAPAEYNKETYGSTTGVDVYGNLSRRGGGLAADGSFVFGKILETADIYAEMSIKKSWAAGITDKPIAIKVFVEENGEKIEVATVPLTGEAKESSELDTIFDDGKDEDGNYTGRFILPTYVEKRNNKGEFVEMVQVFDIIADGKDIQLNKVEDLADLADAIYKGKDVKLSSAGRKIVFEEYIIDGYDNNNEPILKETDEFELSPGSVSLENQEATIKSIIQKQTDGEETTVITTASFSELAFNADLTNDHEAEIDKYVNKAVHKNISLDEEFEYDIIAYVKHNTDKLIIEDELVDDLEFASEEADVKVVSLEENNHKPANDINNTAIAGNEDASVAKSGTPIDVAKRKVTIDPDTNKLEVVIENKLDEVKDGSGTVIGYENADTDQNLKDLWGKWVKVSFKAQIKESLQNRIKAGEKPEDVLKYAEIKAGEKYQPEGSIYDEDGRPKPNLGNNPVKSNEDHKGVENTASYKLEVKNEGKWKDESNTVTVKPQQPEIEKFVDQAVHKDINIDDEFTYDIVAFVTDDAATVKITDELNSDLQFVSGLKDVKIADLGTINNHKVTNDIAAVKVNDDASVAEEGDKITDAKVSINGKKLVVDIPDATAYRGHWVKVTFKAKIAEGKKVQDLKYTVIKDADEEKRYAPNVGNDPVISDEDHKGVPNNASYEIGVKNSAGIVETKYDDESNTVTVKPDEIPVYFSKKELDGEELEGATIVVKDEEGNVIEEWVSTTESHRIDLKPGKYSMQEVVAPDGFQRVTTTIWFEVNEDGKVTLLTAEVDNGGKISIMDADHIILEDAPVKNPLLTIKKTSKTKNAMPGDVIDYVITIENSGDGDAEAVEVVDTMDNNLTYVSDNSNGVNDGQKVTWIVDVAAGKTKTIKIKCRVDEDAAGKVINKAEITNYETEFVDNGDDEHDVVLGKYKNKDSGSKTRGARTGDETQIVLWSITLLLTLALVVVLRIRRRYQR